MHRCREGFFRGLISPPCVNRGLVNAEGASLVPIPACSLPSLRIPTRPPRAAGSLAAGLSCQPIRIGLGVVPAQAGSRMRSVVYKPGIAPRAVGSDVELGVFVGPTFRARVVSGLAHEGGELIHRYLELSHGERPRDRDDVLRAFPGVAALLALWRAHGERSRRYHHHLRTAVAFPEAVRGLERALAFRRERLGAFLRASRSADQERQCRNERT